MSEENIDEIPDTVDELLGVLKKRRNVYRGLQNREDLEAWRNQQINTYLERFARARAKGCTEALQIELPRVDVAKLRLWINESGQFESVEDFVRRMIWDKLDNLPWEDIMHE